MNPVGVCKEPVMLLLQCLLFPLQHCGYVSCFGIVPPFRPRGSLALYAGRSQSPGKLLPSLVCQVVMPWTRPGGEQPKVR